jgi:hypothetical protein
MILSRTTFAAAMAVATATVFTSSAKADYSFGYISNNSGQADDIAGQFTMTVQAVGTNQVSFTFTNTGSNNCVITEIHFEAGTYLGSAVPNSGTQYTGSGTSFNGYAPSNFPEGNTVNFNESHSFNATPPPVNNGVNVGDSITLTFNLLAGVTFEEVIAALDNQTLGQGETADDRIRVGIHVQSINPGGYSDSFVNWEGDPEYGQEPEVGAVPAPAGLVLAVIGVAGLGGVSLRRRLRGEPVAA